MIAPSKTNPMGERPSDRPMWCDDFDMDLPKVLPQARTLFEGIDNVELHTHCSHPTGGVLNHPCVWNTDAGLAAYFGFRAPRKPEACWTSGGVVACTVWEAIRDAWAHSLVMIVEGRTVLDTSALWTTYETILWDVRGWRKDSRRATRARAKAMAALGETAALLRTLIERDQAGTAEPVGVVPGCPQ